MCTTVRKSAATAAALGALGLGGAAIAGAADSTLSQTNSSSGTGSSQTGPARSQRQALASDVAARVKAAALEKVPGATVLRSEAGGPGESVYHAHIKKSTAPSRSSS